MPPVYPFRALRYASPLADLSSLVAPPYDVLDAQGKSGLLAKSRENIVAVDLPHIPAKELGPPGAYASAAATLRAWVDSGVLRQESKPVMAVYRQTFQFHGTTQRRTGMFCTLDAVPFGPRQGGGVLPHEETFSGPKEDRLALMRATSTQLSPIFGLHQDEGGGAARLLANLCAAQRADVTADTDDGTHHELRLIAGESLFAQYAEALRGEDVFIADGHHRYTTALNYLAQLGAGLAPDHPARRCMFVLVSMSDPGLVIGPTHRVLGGMSGYSMDALVNAARGTFDITPIATSLNGLEAAMDAVANTTGRNALGLYDFSTRACAVATPSVADPLLARFPGKPREWRLLDVALVQYLLVEEIAQKRLNAGQAVRWAFPHSISEVNDIGAGHERGSGVGKDFAPQLAVIVRPTPLASVRAVSRAGELMPQKSTFFLPKLATGLLMNPLS